MAPSFPFFAQSVSLPAPSPTPSAPCGFSLLPLAPSLPVFPGVAAPVSPVAVPAAPVAAPAVPEALTFRPFAVSGSSEPPVSSSAPFLPPFGAPGAVPDFESAASGVPCSFGVHLRLLG